MQSIEAYAKQRQDLVFQLLSAAGIAATFLPDHLDPQSEFAEMGGHPGDNFQLRAVADAMAEAGYFFDRMQEAVGLRDPRLTRFGTKRLDCNGKPTRSSPRGRRPMEAEEPVEPE